MAWTDIFGGQTVNPQDLSYKTYSFAANVSLLWDNTTAESNRVVADIMDIAATVAGVVVSMPDARQAGAGAASLIFNAGAESFDVVTATGVAIITIAPGEAWYVWLRDNATQSGLWRAIEFGAGTSAASAASLASATVKASGTALVQAMPVTDVNSAYTVGAAERGKLVRWTGGVGTITLTLAATVGSDWFAAFRNDGTGILTIARSGSDMIDGASSLVLNPSESAMIATDGAGYYTMAKSIALNNTFTLTSIAVPGTGDYTLSSGEIGFSSYVFTGILTGNRTIIVPATVAPYRVRNSTTGSFTLTVKTADGTGVVVDQNNGKFLTSDGTNVFDQVTPGIATPIAIADGGTGATTASGARTNLGATSLGGDLFTTANAGAARTSLGATATGGSVFTAADAAAARTAIALGTLATLSSVATANLDDGASTNAKLASMAQATIKGRAAAAGTGDPADLTAAQMQTILGAAGAWVTLSEHVASSSATIDITGIPAGAKVVEIYFDNVAPATNSQNLRLRTSADGSTYDGGASDYRFTQLRSTVGGSVVEAGSDAAEDIVLTSAIGNAAARYVQGVVTLHNPGQAGYRTGLNYQADGVDSTGAGFSTSGGGHRRTDGVVVAVRFFFASGNINTGRFVARYFV